MNIRCRHQFAQRLGPRETERLFGSRGKVGIVKGDLEPESLRTQRCRGSDTTKAQYPERLSPAAAHRLLRARIPANASCAQLCIIRHDSPYKAHRQGHRVIGHLAGPVIRCIANRNTAFCAGGDVDVVVPDASLTHYAAAIHMRYRLAGDRISTSAIDQRIAQRKFLHWWKAQIRRTPDHDVGIGSGHRPFHIRVGFKLGIYDENSHAGN